MSRKTAVKETPAVKQQAPKRKSATVVTVKAGKGKTTAIALLKNNPTNTLSLIAGALKDPNFKPENMRLVLDMHKEMVAEQSRLDFIGAFHAMKKELPIINRDGRIVILEKGNDGKRVAGRDRTQQDTPFATYDNLRKKCDPILDRHGFTMWDETEPSPDGTRLLVKTHLDHVNGHGRVTVFPLPAETTGSKNNVQAWGSSNSYGRRYGCLNLLNLRTQAPEDRDTDGNRPVPGRSGKPMVIGDKGVVEERGEVVDADAVEVCSEDQLVKVRDAIAGCGVSDKAFCKHFQIEKVSQLPAASFEDALAACRSYAEKGK